MPRGPPVRCTHFVSPFTRFRAWWMGIDNAELLARCGERGLLRTMWIEWRGTIAVISCGGVFILSRMQAGRANEILENVELNRQRYYKRDFHPEYVHQAPQAVYDGARGYAYRDEVSGLMLNADKKIVSDLTREQRKERLESAVVTPEMVEAARRLRQSERYT